MSDKHARQSRRRLVGALLSGTGAVMGAKALPEEWTRPVTKGVILPAHAQTSPVEVERTIECSSPTSTAVQDGPTLSITVTVVPAPTTNVDLEFFCNGTPIGFTPGIPLLNFAGGTSATVGAAAPASSGQFQCAVGNTWEIVAFHPLDNAITTSCTWTVVSPPPE